MHEAKSTHLHTASISKKILRPANRVTTEQRQKHPSLTFWNTHFTLVLPGFIYIHSAHSVSTYDNEASQYFEALILKVKIGNY